MKIFTLLTILLSFSFSTLYAGDIYHLEYKLNKIRKTSLDLPATETLDTLRKFSNEFQRTAKRFHKSVNKDIVDKKPLTGAQLTSLHKLVSLYISLSYQLQKKSRSTKNQYLKIMLHFEVIRLAANSYLPMYTNKKLRLLLNAEDKSFNISKNELRKHLSQVIDKKNLDKLRQEILKAKDLIDVAKYKSIKGHSVYNRLSRPQFFSRVRKYLNKSNISDFASNASQFAIHHLSGAFGNTAGSIKWRKGYLYRNKTVLKEIYGNLKPLDVITEKAGFALTDTFIPGHFGHNAIWLGTKEELIRLGLWESVIPDFIKVQIEAGKLIIETDRSGTHLKSLEDFMNVDEFAILRIKREHLPLSKYQEIYKVAFSQLGKTYDFNFDVETTDKLVCSELLYQSFGNINWPTADYLGRTTISPDNIASLTFFEGTPLKLVYYVAGNKSGFEYKNIENLASDIALIKKEDSYYQSVKVCKVRRIKKPGPPRRGTRASNYINIKRCTEKLEGLKYEKRDIEH